MEQNSTIANVGSAAVFAGQAWFDPIEAGIRDRVRGFIEDDAWNRSFGVLKTGKRFDAAIAMPA